MYDQIFYPVLNWATCFQQVKNLLAMQETQETQFQSPGWEDSLEEEMATHSSSLAWEIPWTEAPRGLQSMGSQRVGHDWATKHTHTRLSSYWVVLISVLSVFYIQAHCQIRGLWIVYICKDDLTFNFLNVSFEKQKVSFLGSLIYQMFSFMIHASCVLSKNSLALLQDCKDFLLCFL